VTTPGTGRTEQLPLFPLSTVLTPEMPLSLHVFEPRYRQLVADLLDAEVPGAPEFGVVALRHGWEVGTLQDVYRVGTAARVTDVLPQPDGQCDLSAVGERRFEIEAIDTDSRPYLTGTVRWLGEPEGQLGSGSVAATQRAVARHRQALSELNIEFVEDAGALSEPDARRLSYAAARLASLPVADRQRLLECADVAGRLTAARAILRRETELILQLRAIPVSASAFRPGPGGR
jgi:Lon protease-like protein